MMYKEDHKWSLKDHKSCIELPSFNTKPERENHFWNIKMEVEKHEKYEAPELSLFDSVSSVSGADIETPKAANPYFHNEFQEFVV